MKEKSIIILILTLILIGLSGYAFKEKCMTNDKYYIDSLNGPIDVTELIKEDGYKIIGRYKLLNPNPLKISSEDIEFLHQELPAWLAEKYPEINIVVEDIIGEEYLRKINYEFTVRSVIPSTEISGGDVSILKIGNEDYVVNIYLAKGWKRNENKKLINKIIILDEEWHESISDPTPFNPTTDFW